MTVRIEDEDDGTLVTIDIQPDGRILLDQNGIGIYLDRDVARQIAWVLIGITGERQ